MNKMKRAFIIPVFNEIEYLNDFLKNLIKYVDKQDIVIFVDDCSTDGSHEFLIKIKRDNFFVIKKNKNTGLGDTLKLGFDYFIDNFKNRKYHIITIDSDFQHDLSEIDYYIKQVNDRKLDLALISRDFDKYPFYKVIGNKILSFFTSLITFQSFSDVETGFRIFNSEALIKLNLYYKGYKYSCAQEIAVISAALNLKIDNKMKCHINHYRSNTVISDFFINILIALHTRLRMLKSIKRRRI